MLKFKVAAISVLAALNTFAETGIEKPCPSRPGASYPVEGSGICRGNNQITIPLNTAGISLVYNSQSKVNRGYGVGWSVSSDQYFEKSSAQQGVLFLGDGTKIDFFFDGTKWVAQYPVLYNEKLVDVSKSTLKESHVDASYLRFNKLGNTNRYAISASISRKGTLASFARANTIGSLSRLTNFFNQSVQFTYAANGLLSGVMDYKAASYLFTHDSSMNLIKINYPDGSFAEFSYLPGTSLVTSYKNRKGKTATFNYLVAGSDSALKSITDTEGLNTEVIYSSNSVDVKGFAYNLKETFSEIDGLKKTERVQNGIKLLEIYDDKMRLVQSKNHLEEVATYAYSGNSPLVSNIQNADGTEISYVYDAKEKVVKETLSGGGQAITKTYLRDQYGQVIEEKVGSLSHKYLYDAKGNVTKVTDPAQKTAYSATYYSNSKPSSITNIEGNTSTFSYDSIGNPIVHELPTGEKIEAQYDALGLPIKKAKVEQCSTSAVSYQYDSMGRPVVFSNEVQGAEGNQKAIRSRTYGATLEVEEQNAYQLNGSSYKEVKKSIDSKGRTILRQETLAK